MNKHYAFLKILTLKENFFGRLGIFLVKKKINDGIPYFNNTGHE